MRLSLLALIISAASLSSAQAIDSDRVQSIEQENTVFNGKSVPPLLDLTTDTFDEEIKASKFMVVKYYNPQCPHCIAFAPTYQTLYEYYYTSKPETTSNKPISFRDFYDIRFANLNCMAYGDICKQRQVRGYPQVSIFKNGKTINLVTGGKDMTVVSDMIEEALEADKPGTRPARRTLPEPGDQFFPKKPAGDDDEPTKKDEKPSEASSSEEEEVEKIDIPKKVSKDKISNEEEGTASMETHELFPFDNSVAEKARPTRPTDTPNTRGVSVPLTAEKFQDLVTATQEAWFVKFYAPWCHHCQAMASNWQQLAKTMQGKLNVGEVNCEADSRLCKDVRVRGYPTILFFRGGERVEYNGLRGLGDFIQYAEKAVEVGEGVPDVDVESLAALEEKEEVIFIYFYDHATTTEDFMALERLPLSLIGRAKLVRTRDPELINRYKITTWPRLLVSREGRPTYYTPLTPNEMRDTRSVLSWMRSVWLPIVPELTATNAREIMEGKMVVLGVLNRENQESFLAAKREMKMAANEWMDKQIQEFQLERQNLRDAKQLRLEEAEDRNDQRALRSAKQIRINMDWKDRKEVTFAWVDGVFWQRWIRTTYGVDVKDGERVIINDEDNKRYWDVTVTSNYIMPSRVSISETISKVTVNPPLIKPKFTISAFSKFFFDIRTTFAGHPYLAGGCVVGLGLSVVQYLRRRWRRSRAGGHFRLDDNLPIKELKDGFLGNGANGKVD